MALPKDIEEMHEQINSELKIFEAETDEAARNLGIVLSEAAISGRRQGFFAGMKKERERSQKLVQTLEKILGILTRPLTQAYLAIEYLNEIEVEVNNALTEHNNTKP